MSQVDTLVTGLELLDGFSVPVYVVNPDRKIVFANPAFSVLTGLRPREIRGGKTCCETLALDTCSQECVCVQAMRQGRPVNFGEVRGRTPLGQPIIVNIVSVPLRDSSGQVVAAVQQLTDLSVEERIHRKYRERVEELERANEEMKTLYAKLVDLEKSSTIGLLTSGIAHELNNPLSVITGYVDLALRELEEMTRSGQAAHLQSLREMLATMAQSAQQCARITHGMLSYVRRPQTTVTSKVVVRELIEEAVRLFRLQPRASRLEIVRAYQDPLPEIAVARDMLIQCLLNLLGNACQAMNGLGKVTLRAVPAEDPGYVEISVADEGPGIPAAIRDKLFTPLFTTKAQGQGTGLGLFLVRHIIQKHEGEITVESEEGKGAKFTLRLRVQSRVERTPEQPGRRVLIVEDDEPVRKMLRFALERAGYVASEAADGEQAIRLMEQEGFAAIITDFHMPRLNGDAVCRYAAASHRQQEAGRILMSGSGLREGSAELRNVPMDRFLCKPVNIPELLAVISKCTDQRRKQEGAQSVQPGEASHPPGPGAAPVA